MNLNAIVSLSTLWLTFVWAATTAQADEPSLADSLILHASFDEKADADYARGDGNIYTAETLKRQAVKAGLHSDVVKLKPDGGKFGGGLKFEKKSDRIVFFKGPGNLPKLVPGFQGTISFWLRLNPDLDLPEGYVDPLQITDKKWNDASFFVDFTKELPRRFRLGAYSDYKFWNPKDRKDVPDEERPLITVAKPPFTRDAWTHVGITFHGFNEATKSGVASLYLNGRRHGELRRKQQFTWGEDRLAIMLGIYYVGGFDDFAIFNRALSREEMKQLFELPNGVKSLGKSKAK